jgi:hypothetical protein
MVDTVNVVADPVEPEKGTQEYTDKMAEAGASAVNNGRGESEPVPAKPEGVPDKFYNADTGEVDVAGLAKSYTELEKNRSKEVPKPPKVETKGETSETPSDKESDGSDKEQAEAVVESAGLDMASLSDEYATAGELTTDSYAKLEAVGITKDVVDAYINGQNAIINQAKSSAFELADGEEGYTSMIEWAKANLSESEIKAYNNNVNSPDSGVRETVIRGLHARYTGAEGSGGELVTGKTGNATKGSAYESNSQLMADMNNPKYKEDEAFRAQVQDKLSRSSLF